MTKKRSDALQALLVELIDAEQTVTTLREAEEKARQDSVAARQALDVASARTKDADTRRSITAQALDMVASRDDVSAETLDALRARLAR